MTAPTPTRMGNPARLGHVLRDLWLEVSPTEAAHRLVLDPAKLQALLAAKIPLTPQPALALEARGPSNVNFWMRVQAANDLAQELLRRDRRSRLPDVPECTAKTVVASS